jgi:hypothetical protein
MCFANLTQPEDTIMAKRRTNRQSARDMEPGVAEQTAESLGEAAVATGMQAVRMMAGTARGLARGATAAAEQMNDAARETSQVAAEMASDVSDAVARGAQQAKSAADRTARSSRASTARRRRSRRAA